MNREFGAPTKSERIISSISASIRNGELKTGQVIPSINSAAGKFGVARKTVIRGYNKLIEQGFIESRPKKGYFVVNRQPDNKLRVLFIIHSFDAHFQTLYNDFRERVKDTCEIEIYFHHYNIKILDLIISRNASVYDFYVISSFDHPRISRVIGRIPAGKILIVSRNDRLGSKYNSIVQDFFQGTYHSLVHLRESIHKYKRLLLCFPGESGHPESLKRGFLTFCMDYGIPCKVIDSLDQWEIKREDAYLVIDDCDLVKLLKVCKIRNWELGKDVGVISYNETPLKEVIRDGITVISCSFQEMAAEMAEFVKRRRTGSKILKIRLIQRNSI